MSHEDARPTAAVGAAHEPPSQAVATDRIADAGTTPDQAGSEPWQTLTLTPVGDAGNGVPIRVRVLDDAVDDASQLFADRATLSSELTRGLEQDGWEVDRRQRLLPIQLSDGRQVVVPIEEVELRSPGLVQF